jgi:hypothetical protein
MTAVSNYSSSPQNGTITIYQFPITNCRPFWWCFDPQCPPPVNSQLSTNLNARGFAADDWGLGGAGRPHRHWTKVQRGFCLFRLSICISELWLDALYAFPLTRELCQPPHAVGPLAPG